MTASTNTIILETEEGDHQEYSGVRYAEQAYRTGDVNAGGVAIQYARQPGDPEPETEFIEEASLVGVYDDVADDWLGADYEEWVTDE